MKDCEKVVDALIEAVAPDAALQEHIARCPGCRAIVAADRAIGAITVPIDADDEALPTTLRDALQRDARPVKALNPWKRAAPGVAVAIVIAVAVLALQPRGDLAQQTATRLGLGLGAAIAGLVVALVLLLHGGRRGLGLPTRERAAFMVLACVGFAVITAIITVPVEGSVHLGGAAAVAARLGCTLLGTLCAMISGAVVFLGARRTAVVSPVTAGGVAGLAAGFVGALVQHLHCPVMDLDHTLVAHVAPLALGALVGALAGRRWLAP